MRKLQLLQLALQCLRGANVTRRGSLARPGSFAPELILLRAVARAPGKDLAWAAREAGARYC